MNYKDRVQKIALLDLELGLRKSLLRLSVSERADYLRRQSPWTLLGAAFIGGAAAGIFSVRTGATRIVPRMISLSLAIARLWPQVARWLGTK